MSQLLQDIFDLKAILKDIDIRLNCRIESGIKQLLAIITNEGDIIVHYTYGELPAIVKRIPWFSESNKTIQAICFDPSATWLLVTCSDNSLYIIPALSLVDKKQKIDCKWSVTDLTHFPKHPLAPDSKPLCAIWWQTLECNQNALIGYENGSIGLISLTDGRCLGYCTISEPVIQLIICQDNSQDTVALLINANSGQQYRLLLEQPSVGYLWPPEAYNLNEDSTRSRLYNLRQLGVDKFFSFKQRIVDGGRGPRRDSQASDTTSESSHSEHSSTASVPELLPRLCDTYFASQYAKNRYLFSAFYKPTALLTVHASDIESAPLYIHRLPLQTKQLLLTDRLIFTVHDDLTTISVVSFQLSECNLEGESLFNQHALLAQFKVQNDEKILDMYKLTDVTIIKGSRKDEKKDNKTYSLPKTLDDLNLRKTKIDTCVIVTTNSVYKLILNCQPSYKFIKLINEEWNVDLAEYLAVIFSLNMQHLLECCGDLLISNGAFHQGLILYKQAKVHLLKRVLKVAVTSDCTALLKFVNLCLSASKIDMSMATKIHIGNLAVMAYTELVLRHGGHMRVANNKEFMNFLYYEEYYDQILAVNVACRAAHWSIVALLAKSRGLQPEVVDALSLTIQSSKLQLNEDYEFLLALSEPCLTQSLLTNGPGSHVIFKFIKTNLQTFPINILQRFSMQLDPSQPGALSLVSKLFNKSSRTLSSLESTVDSLDLETSPQAAVIVREFIETFIFVVIGLVAKTDNNEYDIDLLDNIDEENIGENSESIIKKLPDFKPLSCGYEHAAVVRNNCVFTMGVTTSGCLGLGPILSQSSPPRLVQMLADLRIRVLSVSCGRKHTVALTDFGIYAWGSNSHGQLGLGPFVRDTPYPQVITALTGICIIDIASGQYHTLALTSTGKVYSWGWGIHGQLGHGSCNNEYYPKLLEFDEIVVQITGGHAHSLILTETGKIFGFGSNVFGQLECNNVEGAINKSNKPVWIVVMPDMYVPVERIATSYFHNICVHSNQVVYTWGANPQEVRISMTKYSQKKFGTNGKPYEPWRGSCNVYTSSINKPIEQVATGFRHSVILHNGKLVWNKVKEGEMSSPKLRDEDSALTATLGQRFLHVSCGLDYVMALDTNGKVLAWGNNTMAQTLLGRAYEDFQDGKMLLLRNTKRILKVPQNQQQNTEAYPIEVPNLPTMAITYNPTDHNLLLNQKLPFYRIFNIENNDFYPENYYGYYDSEAVLSKCLSFESYQAASKIAFLDGRFSDSLGFQLNAFKNNVPANFTSFR
nr:uncharacterized protein LOC111427131 [Onthophagus taurus]